MCGAAWAFSTTGSLEGAEAIKTGKLSSLSEQQFIDCDTGDDNGCDGGLMDIAYEYAEKTPIMKESDYPFIYERSNVTKCSDAS